MCDVRNTLISVNMYGGINIPAKLSLKLLYVWLHLQD